MGDQFGAALVNQPEAQFGAHLDQVEKLEFFILGDDRSPQRDVAVAGGGDLRFENLLPFQTLPEDLDRDVAVAIELVLHAIFHFGAADAVAVGKSLEAIEKFFVRHEFQIELDAAVQIQPEPDRTGGVLADQTQHVAVVLDVTRRFDHGSQIRARFVGGAQQRLRLVERGVFLLQLSGLFDQHLRLGDILFVAQHLDEHRVVVALRQRVQRTGEHRHHDRDDDGPEYQRSPLHDITCSRSFPPLPGHRRRRCRIC